MINPVIPGFFPDPSICRVRDDYYLACSSFGFFPGVPIHYSKDLTNWIHIGNALDRPEQLVLQGARVSTGGIYAPTLRYQGGRFYLVTTNVSHRGGFIVTATDPRGPWSDPIWLSDGAGTGIDPSLLFDGDDVYLAGIGTWNKNAIRQARIDPDQGVTLSEPVDLWQGTGGQYPEGPHLYHIGNYYYLSLAEGGTETMHMQTLARSKTPNGPWEPCPHNPILTHRSLLSNLHAVGHADLVEGPGRQWWCVFHGIRPISYPWFHLLGRETCLASVQWNDDGWPIIGDGQKIDARTLEDCDGDWNWSADFSQDRLGREWLYLRNPNATCYSTQDRASSLRILPSPDDLDSYGTVSFAGVRQRAAYFRAEVDVEFNPTATDEYAGITIFANETHHYDLRIACCDGKRFAEVRRRVGDMIVLSDRAGLPTGIAKLIVRGTPESYILECYVKGAPVLSVSTLSRYLSTETAGGFTGAILGLFAIGEKCNPAFFSDFSVRSGKASLPG